MNVTNKHKGLYVRRRQSKDARLFVPAEGIVTRVGSTGTLHLEDVADGWTAEDSEFGTWTLVGFRSHFINVIRTILS